MTSDYRESIISEITSLTGEEVVIIPYGLDVIVATEPAKTTRFQQWINKLLGYKGPKVVIDDVINKHRVEVITITVK